ncbi:MAG: EamA family transporter [Lachnospiraceae bacterium]|nr:EamA family transporter [Lachnospiraceae bacterium]
MNEYFLLMLGSVLVASFSQLLLKKGAQNQYANVIREYLNVWVVSGYALMVASTLLTILAYRGLDYKNGPIIESLGFAFVLILSRLFFGEKITKRKVLGNVLIFAGILIFYS